MSKKSIKLSLIHIKNKQIKNEIHLHEDQFMINHFLDEIVNYT